jgi:hypothetical protein
VVVARYVDGRVTAIAAEKADAAGADLQLSHEFGAVDPADDDERARALTSQTSCEADRACWSKMTHQVKVTSSDSNDARETLAAALTAGVLGSRAGLRAEENYR